MVMYTDTDNVSVTKDAITVAMDYATQSTVLIITSVAASKSENESEIEISNMADPGGGSLFGFRSNFGHEIRRGLGDHIGGRGRLDNIGLLVNGGLAGRGGLSQTGGTSSAILQTL